MNDAKLKKTIQENIAISNFKEKVKREKLRNKKIFYSVLSSCAMLIICTLIISNSNKELNIEEVSSIKDKESNINLNSLTIKNIIKDIDEDKIFNITTAYSTIETSPENLYNHSDVVLIGTFNSNLKSYVSENLIHTHTKFDTLTVIKNKTNIDVKDSVIFDRLGGAVTLSEYEKTASLRKDEFTNIPTKERSSYYVVQPYAPSNKLDFTSKNSTPYLLFLSYRDGELHSLAGYYGMREINENNEIYDYDTNTYISSNLIE